MLINVLLFGATVRFQLGFTAGFRAKGLHAGGQYSEFCSSFTHRPLSSSFLGLYLESYEVIPKKELLRGLWVKRLLQRFISLGL